MKKYKFTGETIVEGVQLHRICAIRDFADVKTGDVGGWIEKENNLSHDDNAWVSGDAKVSGNAEVFGDAEVSGNAWVSGYARVSGYAWVFGDARVSGNAKVSGNALVSGNARVSGYAWVSGDAEVSSSNDYIILQGFGSENRPTTMYNDAKRGIAVACGCFGGDLQAFAAQVKETHGDSKYAKEYLMCIELAKLHFGLETEDAEA